MKWTWAPVAFTCFILGACNYPQPCPDAGGIPEKSHCYYLLSILEKDPATKEVKAKVAPSVPAEVRSHFWNQWEMEEYNDNTFVARVDDSDFDKIDQTEPRMYVIKPGEKALKLCTTGECQAAVAKFKAYTPTPGVKEP